MESPNVWWLVTVTTYYTYMHGCIAMWMERMESVLEGVKERVGTSEFPRNLRIAKMVWLLGCRDSS
jgi:hypothetical protein